jgi:hypothetical protein
MIAAGVIGLMTAALGDLDERANAFAIGFVVCRVIAARAASRTRRLLTSWPAVQLGGLTTPWIVSIWVDAPAKYWIWAAAMALELVFAAARAVEGTEAAGALIERLDARMRGGRGGGSSSHRSCRSRARPGTSGTASARS